MKTLNDEKSIFTVYSVFLLFCNQPKNTFISTDKIIIQASAPKKEIKNEFEDLILVNGNKNILAKNPFC